jgi:hypothetical protein
MIAVLKRSGFHDRKRTQGLDCAARNHTFVFSGARDIFSGELSIAPKRKSRQAFVAVRIDSLAYDRHCVLPAQARRSSRRIGRCSYQTSPGRIAPRSAREFLAIRGMHLGEIDRAADGGPAGNVVVASRLWKLSRERGDCRRWDQEC